MSRRRAIAVDLVQLPGVRAVAQLRIAVDYATFRSDVRERVLSVHPRPPTKP